MNIIKESLTQTETEKNGAEMFPLSDDPTEDQVKENCADIVVNDITIPVDIQEENYDNINLITEKIHSEEGYDNQILSMEKLTQICIELINIFRDIKGVNGVHLMGHNKEKLIVI